MSVYRNMLLPLLLFECIWLVGSETFTGSDFVCNQKSECRSDTILCDANTNCTITCSGEDSCKYARIVCPTDANCIINCASGPSECVKANINATVSTSLHFNCEQSSRFGCDDTTVYCPNNGYSGPTTCKITTRSESTTLINVYAVEGFNDVEIIGPVPNLLIHCTENYQTLSQCAIFNTSNNLCSECHNIFLPTTGIPTTEPSIEPTNEPTIEPTFGPTTVPTLGPTTQPSTPTAYPTDPSILPTQNPTMPPTPSPTLIIGFNDPTFAPIIEQQQAVTTNVTVFISDDDNQSLQQNGTIFSRQPNVIILILSIFIFLLLLCVIGIVGLIKYENKRKRTEIIVIQMNSKPKLDDMQATAVEVAVTSMSSGSNSDNFDKNEFLMDLNVDEGDDILMNNETAQYDHDQNQRVVARQPTITMEEDDEEEDEEEKDEESSLTLKHQHSNVYKNTMTTHRDSSSKSCNDNVVIIVGKVAHDEDENNMEEKLIIKRDDDDDSEEDVMHGLTDIGDAVVDTPKQPQVDEVKETMVMVKKMEEIESVESGGDDIVLLGITDDGDNDNEEINEDDSSQNIFNLDDKIGGDLIDMDGLTDIGDLVVGI